jgi:fibro-slime domain-containing protein
VKTHLLSAAALGLALFVGSARAASFDMHGTIRDFHATHPNMEATINGVETGIVLSALGADGTPDFNPATTAKSVTNAADFAQWYHDVAGVNMSQPFSITLTEGPPGVFVYDNGSFFPIDGQLFGDEGNAHNYHFTLELHCPFVYEAGQFLEASADDDLWVFIDGELALDIGGIHPTAGGSIDLDTLGLTPGNTYDLDIFFAERHTVASTFKLKTDIQCVPEPSALALGLAGAAGLGVCVWPRRRHVS